MLHLDAHAFCFRSKGNFSRAKSIKHTDIAHNFRPGFAFFLLEWQHQYTAGKAAKSTRGSMDACLRPPESSEGPCARPAMMPAWELGPTAITRARPLPSNTLLPLRRRGWLLASFRTSSASPVSWLSSILHGMPCTFRGISENLRSAS